MSLRDRLNQEPKKEIKQNIEKEVNKEVKTNIKLDKKLFKKQTVKPNLGAIDPLLSDSEINSIYINGAKDIHIIRNAKAYESTITYRDDFQLETIIKKTASDLGLELDPFNPFVKFKYKEGVSVLMMLPPLSRVPNIYIKCYKDSFASFETFLEGKGASREILSYLQDLLNKKENIIIAGPKNSLKTSLLSALIKKVSPRKERTLIDYTGEIPKFKMNIFDFSSLENKKEILDLILSFEADNLFLNDPKDDLINFIPALLGGLCGVVITLEAKNKEEVLDKLIDLILTLKPHWGYEGAKNAAAKIFGHIIFTNEKRKISLATKIEEHFETKDVFYLNESGEHKTADDPSFSHTYIVEDKKNVDILQKFKKKQPDDLDNILDDENL